MTTELKSYINIFGEGRNLTFQLNPTIKSYLFSLFFLLPAMSDLNAKNMPHSSPEDFKSEIGILAQEVGKPNQDVLPGGPNYEKIIESMKDSDSKWIMHIDNTMGDVYFEIKVKETLNGIEMEKSFYVYFSAREDNKLKISTDKEFKESKIFKANGDIAKTLKPLRDLTNDKNNKAISIDQSTKGGLINLLPKFLNRA